MLSGCKNGLDQGAKKVRRGHNIESLNQGKWYYIITYTNLLELLVSRNEVEGS